MPDPATTAIAVSGAVKAVAEFLSTPEGQKLCEQARTDRAAWEKFWKDAELGVKTILAL